MKIREPAVAGYFYPSRENELSKMVDQFLSRGEKIYSDAKGILSPHAGYVYSGYVAGSVIGSVPPFDTAIILGPNHTGSGTSVSVYPPGKWVMPGFEINIDEELSNLIVEEWEGAEFDTLAHRNEHSIEVQLPFLYRKNPQMKVVCITLGFHNYARAKEGGEAVGRVLKKLKDRKILLVASSDMSHYERDDVARQKDKFAIEQMKKMDDEQLLREVMNRDISMCGVMPAIAVIVASKLLKAKEGILVDYMTSGDTGGGKAQVVGYAGMVFH